MLNELERDGGCEPPRLIPDDSRPALETWLVGRDRLCDVLPPLLNEEFRFCWLLLLDELGGAGATEIAVKREKEGKGVREGETIP